MGELNKMGIEATTMALRENIMGYFKYTEKLLYGGSVYMISATYPSNYQYQRQAAQRENRQHIMLGGVPLFTVHKDPDTIIFHRKPLGRSPQLREIGERIEKFVDNYLAGVEKEYNDASVR